VAGTPNVTGSKPKRVLMVIANPSVSTTLGWPVGFWGSELTHAWYAFTEAGYDVTVASPKGGKCELDALSDPRDESGYSAGDLITMGFLHSPSLASLHEGTPKLTGSISRSSTHSSSSADVADVHVPRRQDAPGCDPALLRGAKPTAALCHGVSALIDVSSPPLVPDRGKTITGFSNGEETPLTASSAEGDAWRIEDAAQERGANYVHGGSGRRSRFETGG
jgi:putative intracellular protease/amidase